MSDPSTATIGDPDDEEQFVEDDETQSEEDEAAHEVLWTSDDALSFAEARRLTSKRGATVVMFAGDTEAGKTSAMVEIWTSLLSDGRLGTSLISGSNNALAFELRSFDSRVESGMNTTARTSEDTEGFLHLSVTSARGRIEILFADYAGEHFTRIREGVEARDELPWIGRVDRLAVLVDGSLVASPAFAEVAFTRAQRLLWKFQECPDRNSRLRAALVLTKAELVPEARLVQFQPSMNALLALVREIDPEAPLLYVSARPATRTAPVGLDGVLDWICMPDRDAPVEDPVLEQPPRAFGRFS